MYEKRTSARSVDDLFFYKILNTQLISSAFKYSLSRELLSDATNVDLFNRES